MSAVRTILAVLLLMFTTILIPCPAFAQKRPIISRPNGPCSTTPTAMIGVISSRPDDDQMIFNNTSRTSTGGSYRLMREPGGDNLYVLDDEGLYYSESYKQIQFRGMDSLILLYQARTCTGPGAPPPDIIFYNGVILTMDVDLPQTQANAIWNDTV